MIITPDSYRKLPHHRAIANHIITTLGLTPDKVMEIRSDETGTEVDWTRDPDPAIRTLSRRPACSQVLGRETTAHARPQFLDPRTLPFGQGHRPTERCTRSR